MRRHGYLDRLKLASMVRGWQGLIDLIKPDLIVAEYSPTLCLAAWGEITPLSLASI